MAKGKFERTKAHVNVGTIGHVSGNHSLGAVVARILTTCASDRDGDCSDTACPQIRDGEPHKSNRNCPLWVDPSDSYQ